MKSKIYLSRHNHNCNFTVLLFLLFLSLIALTFPAISSADEADDLARSANKSIRAAERNMHQGKTDQSVEMLEQARTTLDSLKAANPSHRQLKSLENKYTRIKKQIDRKLAGSKATTSSSASS